MTFDADALVALVQSLFMAFWIGSVAYHLRIQAPAVHADERGGSAFLTALMRRGGVGPTWYGPVGKVTVVATLYLFVAGKWYQDPFGGIGHTMLTLGVVALASAMLFSLIVMVPREKKMKAIVDGLPAGELPTPTQAGELMALSVALRKGGLAQFVLLLLAFILMGGRAVFV